MRQVICTICTNDHLFKVKALFRSLEDLTDASFHCLITDEGARVSSGEGFSLLTLSELRPDRLKNIASKYRGDELRWACKPLLLEHLLDNGFDRVIYLENDISFYRSPDFIFSLLERHSVILTPHYYPTDPEKDQHWLESNFRVGLYNAGFVGVSRSGIHAMQWWAKCCRYNVKKSAWRGLFDDQKYLDLIPVIFDDVLVLRHHGCNVAGWNVAMSPRSTDSDGNIMLAGKWPLVFIHFNAFTMREIERGNDPALLPLLRAYESALQVFRPVYTVKGETRLTLASIPLIIRHVIWKFFRWAEKR